MPRRVSHLRCLQADTGGRSSGSPGSGPAVYYRTGLRRVSSPNTPA
jgi:hypothetical protein